MELKLILLGVILCISPLKGQTIQKISNNYPRNDTTQVIKKLNNETQNKLKKFYLPDYIFAISGLAISYDWAYYKITQNHYNKKQKEYQKMRENKYEKYKKIHKEIDNDIHTLNILPKRIKIEKTIIIGSFVASIAFRIIGILNNKKQKEYNTYNFYIEPSFYTDSAKNYGLQLVFHF